MVGTDYLGRDMLSRILEGARYTVGIALAAAAIACVAAASRSGMIAAVTAGGLTCGAQPRHGRADLDPQQAVRPCGGRGVSARRSRC